LKAGVVATALAGVVATQPASAQLSAPPAPIKTYPGDPGRAGDPASWRTPEFLSDDGLLSIGAEFAYAGGYSGTGMNVGIVDSGYFAGHVREHGSLDTNYRVGDRYHSVTAQGGKTGPTPGFFDQAFNDSHGTHISGTVAASRDGTGETTPAGPEANMHGVAFNSDVYVGNTHKTDGVFYGLLPPTPIVAQTPDNAYLANVYRAVNAAKTANGKPIRIITSSWGSQSSEESYNTLDPPPGAPGSFGLNAGWRFLSTADGVADANGNTVHWLNGAIEVARTGTILQFSAGNGGYDNPTPRGAAPYYLPDLEGRWYTTSGIDPEIGRTFDRDGSVRVPGEQEFNGCGVAKWSCVTAPSRRINSTTVEFVDGTLQPRYDSAFGTSMAGAHSAAALALIMQRFPYMTNEQALYTMFTTGRQNATRDSRDATVANRTAGQMVQVPDRLNGWNTVSLRDAFAGPGQLLGPFTVDTHGYSDVWSNDISDVAIRARRRDDADEAAAWGEIKRAKGWSHGLPADASDVDRSDFATGTRREQARNHRAYEGSLGKRGNGTLFLTGDETWRGATTVAGGKLSVNGRHARPIRVRGGTLGGRGTVGDIVVTRGVLAPGLAPEEAARITDVQVAPGDVLHVNGNVAIDSGGSFAVTVRGDCAATSLDAAGDVLLDGGLHIDAPRDLHRGAELTIIRGRSIRGRFSGPPVVAADGHVFKVCYGDHSVSLRVLD